MTEDIYIVSGSTCQVNVDVEGDYILSCVAISGRLAITTVDAETDYIKYLYTSSSGDVIEREIRPAITVRTTVSAAMIEMITRRICYKSSVDGLYYYKYAITDCSYPLRYLLGIRDLPTKAGEQFQAYPSFNGPTFFQVVCEKLAGCGLVVPNNFIVGSTFQFQGPSYIGDITNVSFSIKGIYDEIIDIDDDLLWQFQLRPLKKDKDKKRKAQMKNTEARLVLK